MCVCLCLCVCVSFTDLLITPSLAIHSRLPPKTHFTSKFMPNTISQPYSNTALFCPTNPRVRKVTFEFQLRFSVFYFLFSATPTGFLTFCLPADKATAKSVTKYSPTDSEKQTAVDCKDNGLFSLTKPLLCQKLSTLVKTPPVLWLLATLATVRV